MPQGSLCVTKVLTIAISTTGPIYKGVSFEDGGEGECDGDYETSMMQSSYCVPFAQCVFGWWTSTLPLWLAPLPEVNLVNLSVEYYVLGQR